MTVNPKSEYSYAGQADNFARLARLSGASPGAGPESGLVYGPAFLFGLAQRGLSELTPGWRVLRQQFELQAAPRPGEPLDVRIQQAMQHKGNVTDFALKILRPGGELVLEGLATMIAPLETPFDGPLAPPAPELALEPHAEMAGLQVGQAANLKAAFDGSDLAAFRRLVGADDRPEAGQADADLPPALLAALFTRLLDEWLLGAEARWTAGDLHFLAPAAPGQALDVQAEVIGLQNEPPRAHLKLRCKAGDVVVCAGWLQARL